MKPNQAAVLALLSIPGVLATSTIARADLFDTDEMKSHDDKFEDKKKTDAMILQIAALAFNSPSQNATVQAALAQVPNLFVGPAQLARRQALAADLAALQNRSFSIGGSAVKYPLPSDSAPYDDGRDELTKHHDYSVFHARGGAANALIRAIAVGDFELGELFARTSWALGSHSDQRVRLAFDRVVQDNIDKPESRARLKSVCEGWLATLEDFKGRPFQAELDGNWELINNETLKNGILVELIRAETEIPGLKLPAAIGPGPHWQVATGDILWVLRKGVMLNATRSRGGKTVDAQTYLANLDAGLAHYGLPRLEEGFASLKTYAEFAHSFVTHFEYGTLYLPEEWHGLLEGLPNAGEIFARIVKEIPNDGSGATYEFWYQFLNWKSRSNEIDKYVDRIERRQVDYMPMAREQEVREGLNAAKALLKVGAFEIARAIERGERGEDVFLFGRAMNALADAASHGKHVELIKTLDMPKIFKALQESEVGRRDIRQWARAFRVVGGIDFIPAMVAGMKIVSEVQDSLRPDLKPGFVDKFMQLEPETREGYIRAMEQALAKYKANPFATDANGALMTFNDHLLAGVEEHVVTQYTAAPESASVEEMPNIPSCDKLFSHAN